VALKCRRRLYAAEPGCRFYIELTQNCRFAGCFVRGACHVAVNEVRGERHAAGRLAESFGNALVVITVHRGIIRSSLQEIRADLMEVKPSPGGMHIVLICIRASRESITGRVDQIGGIVCVLPDVLHHSA
jgi:hypothetical protein